MQFGCYVQVSKEEVQKISEIDLCLGTNEKAEIVKLAEEFCNIDSNMQKNCNFNIDEIENKFIGKNDFELKDRVKIDDVFKNENYSEFGSITYTEKTRAVIKVQDGCDRFCSYCIIPYARGRVRSREPKSVVEEITKIAENGIKEVIITGIHVASYGKDFKSGYGLIDLLEEIDNINGIERVRLRFNRAITYIS